MRYPCAIVAVVAILLSVPAHAQELPRASARKNIREYKGAVYVKTAALWFDNDGDVALLPLTVEYDRMLSDRFSWVAGLSVVVPPFLFLGGWDNSYIPLSLNARIAYMQPLVRRWLFIRAEAGVSYSYRFGGGVGQRSISSMMAELHLVVRFRSGTEIVLSPLFLAPSTVRVSPGNGRNHRCYVESNVIPFGLGFRF